MAHIAQIRDEEVKKARRDILRLAGVRLKDATTDDISKLMDAARKLIHERKYYARSVRAALRGLVREIESRG